MIECIVQPKVAAAFDHPQKAAVLLELAKAPISFDQVRANLNRSAVQLPDGVIMQIALDAGFPVR